MCVPSLRDFRLFLTTGDCRPRLQIVTSLRDCTTAPALSLFSSRCNSFATLIKASRCQRKSASSIMVSAPPCAHSSQLGSRLSL